MSSRTTSATPQDGGRYYGIGHANSTGGDVFAGCDMANLCGVISQVTALGDGITFSRTRDGGAVCVAVLSDGAVSKWYASSSETFDEIVVELLEASKPSG